MSNLKNNDNEETEEDSDKTLKSRRRFLSASAALSGFAVAQNSVGALDNPLTVPQWSKEPGAATNKNPYGQPSSFESDVVRRTRSAPNPPGVGSSLTPLQDLEGIITPGGLHYERHHAGVPQIDPDQHRFVVHGLVSNPKIFTIDDILRLPSVSRIHFLECSGNSGALWSDQPTLASARIPFPVQAIHGLLSCSEWTGVRLSTILEQVGVSKTAKWFLAESADSAGMTRSIPIDKAWDDALVVYAQNGERLRPEQGYPLRLLLPGFEGNTSVKWLRRIKLSTEPFQTREETSKYTDLLPDGKARQFTFVMEAKSVITYPSPGHVLSGPGFYEIRGLAWSGRGYIKRVDVSIDGGLTWKQATLEGPRLSKALQRFRFPWTWSSSPAIIQSRAIDNTGYVQPTREQLVAVRGVNSNYHFNGITRWEVNADGTLKHIV